MIAEQQKIVDESIDSIAGLLHEYVKTTAIDEAAEKALIVFLRATLSASLAHAMKEGELYRRINTEMRQGLQTIYKTITSVAASDGAQAPSQADTLFCEATEQLNEVMATTLEATENIMGEIESMQDALRETAAQLQAVKAVCDTSDVDALIGRVSSFEGSLSRIMTTLSFQDLTGQRLKKVMAALNEIQTSIFDMYVSSGLTIKAREEMPEKGVDEITAEGRRRMDELKKDATGSVLKGPTRGTSQSAVDSLLADLGL